MQSENKKPVKDLKRIFDFVFSSINTIVLPENKDMDNTLKNKGNEESRSLHNISCLPLSEYNSPKTKISQGYFWIYNPEHPRSNYRYVKRAVLVLEEKLGRKLRAGEFSHHIDGNKLNDEPTNLSLTNRSEHFANHILFNGKESRLKDLKKKAKKLCGEDILKIRAMRNAGMKTQYIADHFHVGRTAISNIINEICWGYIKS